MKCGCHCTLVALCTTNVQAQGYPTVKVKTEDINLVTDLKKRSKKQRLPIPANTS